MKPKAAPIFNPKVFLAKVGKGRTLAEYKKSQRIFSQGDRADAIFYIQRGKVKLTVVSKRGKEAVVAILGPADFFGEGCQAGQPLRMAGAAAMSECSIMRLKSKDLVDQLFNSSEKRLARALLLLANFGNEAKAEPVIPKISQETLAEIVGATRSRVSFFMNRCSQLAAECRIARLTLPPVACKTVL